MNNIRNQKPRTRKQAFAILTRLGYKETPRRWFVWVKDENFASIGGPNPECLFIAFWNKSETEY